MLLQNTFALELHFFKILGWMPMWALRTKTTR